MKLFKSTVCILASVLIFSTAFFCSAVSTIVFGDANNDRAIDVRDLVHAKKIIASTSFSALNPDAVDFNGDGNVNGEDLVVLKKVLMYNITPEHSVDVLDFE